jgi:hypothetical protein
MVAGVLGSNLSMLDAALERERSAENPNEERIKAIENQRATTLQIAENYGLTNEEGEFDPTAGREDGGEVEWDPNLTFQGATINLNGTEIMNDAEGGMERTGTGRGQAG